MYRQGKQHKRHTHKCAKDERKDKTMRNNEKMNIMELYNEVKERENKIERTYYHEIIELINNTDLYKKGFTIDSDGNITIICQDWDEWEDEEMIVAIGFSGGILAYVEL